MADLNIVEKANKVLTFRKYIREECRKKGLEYPTDAKIAEYIADCGGDECVYDLNDFMSDYETKDGVFRDPFVDFKTTILNKYDWCDNKPTDEEMREFATTSGYNVDGFIRQHTINSYSPLEKKVLLAVLEKLTIPQLVSLWNEFIEESAMYGEDSYIYDLHIPQDTNLLRTNMKPSDWMKTYTFYKEGGRYMCWHNLNNGEILHYHNEDIKGTIIAYWGDIFPRLITWHSCYDSIGYKGTEGYYENFYDMVVWPIFCEKIGYNFDPMHGTLEEIKAK